jgi:hypothetical protein
MMGITLISKDAIGDICYGVDCFEVNTLLESRYLIVA